MPISTKLVLLPLLRPEERTWLNAYNARVRAALSPLLEGGALDYLLRETAEI